MSTREQARSPDAEIEYLEVAGTSLEIRRHAGKRPDAPTRY